MPNVKISRGGRAEDNTFALLRELNRRLVSSIPCKGDNPLRKPQEVSNSASHIDTYANLLKLRDISYETEPFLLHFHTAEQGSK